ncbi:hypothetical protein [Psychroserpens jangbogonensis]|uniref:hypothetical protein n=1 Tax=Psychroserpens jangbogonensis TaxID=1484460 RepID=UPI00053D68B4|nr:hypothetical protein [Psychroserpens jangbogonensis]
MEKAEKAAKEANQMFLIKGTLSEIKIMKKCDPEMNAVNVKYILDDTKPPKVGYLTVYIN